MFEGIIGNEKIKESLKKYIIEDKISHSYLFLGVEGIGKQLIAKEFAKSILCTQKENNTYCNKCSSCIQFNSSNHADFKIIEPEGSSIKIEQIRQMQEKVQEKPIISKNKIYIINNADLLTIEAQNCLLKTLEEPPIHTIIMLIGSNENAFLSTIKSRCMIIHFQKINDEEIKEFLKNEYEITNISSNMIKTFQGSIKRAIEQKDNKEQYEKIEKIIKSLKTKDTVQILKNSRILYQSKESIFQMLDDMNVILINLAKEESNYANCIFLVEETKKRLKQNANLDMCIDNLLLQMIETV